MGNPDRPGAGRGADQQLLPHRPRDRPPVRPGHLPVGQPRRPGRGRGPDAGPAVQRRRHRARRRSASYVHEHIPGSALTHLSAIGHCPHLSAPEETTAAIRAFLHGVTGTTPSGPRPGPAQLDRLLEEDPADLYENAPVRLPVDAARRPDRAGQPDLLRVDRPLARRAARRAASGPAHHRRPGLPRDPPARRCCGCRAPSRRSHWTSSASTARCCRACSTRSSCATRTAPRCWCGRRCSTRRRAGATSRSCWPRSGGRGVGGAVAGGAADGLRPGRGDLGGGRRGGRHRARPGALGARRRAGPGRRARPSGRRRRADLDCKSRGRWGCPT